MIYAIVTTNLGESTFKADRGSDFIANQQRGIMVRYESQMLFPRLPPLEVDHMATRLPLFVTLLTLTALTSIGLTAGELAPYKGEATASSLDLPDLAGNSHRLEDYSGQVVLVNFWASWCSPCVMELPGMQRLQQKMKDAGKPFTILAVNVAEPRHRVMKFIKMLGLELTVLLDQDRSVFNNWGASVFPMSYLLDTQGLMRYTVLGPLAWDSNAAVDAINDLLEAQEDRESAVSPKPHSTAE